MYAHSLGLSVVVNCEPQDTGTIGTCCDVVIFVARYRGDSEAFSVIGGAFAVPVNHVVNCALVAPHKHAGINEILPEEGFVGNFCYAEFTIAADNDNLAKIRAVANIFALVFLEADTYETLRQIGVQLGVDGNHLCGGDVFHGGNLREAGPVGTVFLLQALEPVYGEPCHIGKILSDFLHLVFQGVDLLVQGFGVELGNLAHRFFHQLEDIGHHYLPMEEILVHLHLGQYVVQLLFPAHLVLFQYLIDTVFEEYPFQGGVVPVFLKFGQFVFQLGLQNIARVPGVVFQDFVHRKEYGLVFANYAGVGRNLGFALREGVQRVYGLVRRHIGRKMDDNFHFVGGHVVYLLDIDFLLVLGLEDAVNYGVRRFAVRDFGDGDG